MNALQVSDLSFAYGAREALKQVSFGLPVGGFAALLGPNGAGKSTLIALLTRLYDVQCGDILVGGHSLQKSPRAALRQLGVVFQQSTLDLDLSVEQNLRYHVALHGLSRHQGSIRIDAELARQHLTERRHERVRDLNGGHRRRVEIARALLHEPRLLLLDEPSVGLDPASRLALGLHVRQLCQEHGISVLWTTHLLDEVRPSDNLLIVHQGRLVASGRADAVSLEHGGSLGSAFTHLTASGVHS
ncbi:UNVERIFIED_ORG: ABC-2 type transport system ATP-binding protein [Pseudomonas lini]|uniref:ABC transporter ATP-binding protein n=1 Tax=Pseudomonas viciae TaxID=2505979 RepID=A0A4P7PGH9_9PSED|nr:ABC transporter ATP-binding protein [Pseudomonas viciae]QBZ89808.1 ATP-binding cassette domain-containing protein [Pseudomonas viciae]UZE89269.1 ATP-binding cassette domain-containing protein [Pseudomonas viciae]WGO96086.1 ABC transporter ATP-binding protein [Pseudomonas viciae]